MLDIVYDTWYLSTLTGWAGPGAASSNVARNGTLIEPRLLKAHTEIQSQFEMLQRDCSAQDPGIPSTKSCLVSQRKNQIMITGVPFETRAHTRTYIHHHTFAAARSRRLMNSYHMQDGEEEEKEKQQQQQPSPKTTTRRLRKTAIVSNISFPSTAIGALQTAKSIGIVTLACRCWPPS